MSNSIAPGSSADVNVKVTALTTNPNVPVTYKTIILKKNLVNEVNTLTQAMISATNTKYVIKYDYTLGENITVPTGCVLEFDGGSLDSDNISPATLVFSGTIIKSEKYKIFGNNIVLSGELKSSLKVEWFGAVGSIDGTAATLTDSTVAIQRAINAAEQTKTRRVIFDKTVYKISDSLVIPTNHYYLGTELTEDKAYPDWLYTEVAKIIITAKVPAFVFNYCKFTTVENIFVDGAVAEYDDIANGDNLCGFYANVETYDAFGSNIFRNVTVKHCTYGIYVEILGFRGFCMNVFTNVGLAENVIGLCIKGTTENSQNPWLNHNNFDNCEFSRNQNVGVYINTNGDIETFVFRSCEFEANGQTTSIANFEEYGVSAINICASGQVEINNCYFEGNTILNETLLQRALTRQEGHIILKHAVAIMRNNVISSAHQVVSLVDWGGVISYYNHWFYTNISPRKKNYFVTIWNIVYGNAINLKFEEGGTTLDDMFGYADGFTPSSDSVSLWDSNIICASNKNGNYSKIGQPYTNNSVLFLNSNGTNYNTGLIKSDAIGSIAGKYGYPGVVKDLKDYTLILTSDVTSRAIRTNYGDASVIVKSDSPTTKRTVSLSGSYDLAENILSGKFIFENVIFDISLSDYEYFIRNSNRVEFVNCDFVFNTVNWTIIASTLIFKNCTFTNNSGSANKPGVRANGASPVYVTFEDCTNENLLNTIANKGTTADRPTTLNASNAGFCYWDTTINKPIYWTGSGWVDATGTSV